MIDAPVAEAIAAVQHRWIGQSRLRTEDDALLRGKGTFVGDVKPAGCLHAAFARSPFARAKLIHVDVERAQRMPGVRLVVTGAMLDGIAPLPVNPIVDGVRAFTSPILARDRVNHVGAPVALVVADDASIARDAVEMVDIDCEALEPCVDTVDAQRGEPLLAGWPDNLAFEKRWHSGNVEEALSAAHRTVEVRIDCPRVAPVALEPRCIVAEASGDRLTLWLPSQSPHRAREHVAQLLGLAIEQVRVIAPDVGGAFGGKASLYPEDVAVAHAALKLRRPVSWVATRNEDMVSASHGRGGRLHARAAFDTRGTLLAVRAELDFPLGGWATFSAVVPAINAARILPGPYRTAAIDIVTRGYVTNTSSVGIYRGAGRPEAAMLMERLMDAGARALALDPVEIRRRNVLAPSAMPHRTLTGQTLDSGRYAELLDRACIDYTALRREQHQRREAGEIVGIGINLYVEPCGAGWESACITRHPDGRFVVASGSSAQGQGHQTAYAQIAASVLDVPIDRITVIGGDSATAPPGIGALASRSMAIGGSAVKAAAEKMLAKLGEPGCDTRRPVMIDVVYTAPGEAWSSGCCLAVISIDRDTGVPTIERVTWVDDAGVVINPLLAEGQLVGGFAQGLGTALMERVHYDAQGQITTGSLLDYAIPRARDMPPFALESLPSATAANALGAKGIGESGCIAAPAAILNAALDALAPHGVTDLQLPLTSETLWRALHVKSGE